MEKGKVLHKLGKVLIYKPKLEKGIIKYDEEKYIHVYKYNLVKSGIEKLTSGQEVNIWIKRHRVNTDLMVLVKVELE